jgi:hypothetical protein
MDYSLNRGSWDREGNTFCAAEFKGVDLSPLLTAITTPFAFGKTHYVELIWNENGGHYTVLEIDKSDYPRFLEWLQRASGIRWLDVDEERQTALEQIQDRAGQAVLVPIRHPTGPEVNYYQVNHYAVLPLDDSDDTKLLFFDGQVKPKNLVWMVPVKCNWSMNDCVSDVAVEYGKCGEKVCEIRAILLRLLHIGCWHHQLKPQTIAIAQD